MNEDDVKKLVEQILTEQRGKHTDPGQTDLLATQLEALKEPLAKRVMEAAQESIKVQVESALKERDEAQVAKEKAETEQREAEEKIKQERAEMEAQAEHRATLMVQFRSLLPEDFDPKGKSVKDILVTAAGEEIEKAAERSEDYLLAKLEGIVERRAQAGGNATLATPPATPPQAGAGPVNLVRLIEQKRAATA